MSFLKLVLNNVSNPSKQLYAKYVPEDLLSIMQLLGITKKAFKEFGLS